MKAWDVRGLRDPRHAQRMHNSCTARMPVVGIETEPLTGAGVRAMIGRFRRRESRRDRMRASHGFAAPRLRRTAVSARRHLGRVGGERRGLLRPCLEDRALPLRRRGPARDRPDRAAGVHPRGLARLLPRPASRPALRAAGARALRAGGGASVQSATSSCSTPTPARSPASFAGTTRSTATGSAARGPISPSTAATARGRCRSAGSSTPPTPGAQSRRAAPRLGGDGDLRGARQGHDQEPPGDRRPARRHLRGPRLAAGGRAPAAARGDGDRAHADPGLLRRPRAGGAGPRQLLGLQHRRLLRAGAALPAAGERHRRVQAHGAAAARGGDRGDPRRGLQPYRRGQPARADAVVPRPRQRELLRAGRRPALLFRHHGLRQHRQHPPPAGGADGDGQLALLGRGLPRRRLPLRPRRVADARPRRGRLLEPVPRRGDAGPGARRGEDDLRELGPRAVGVSGRQLPPGLGGVERALPRPCPRLREGRRRHDRRLRPQPARLGRHLRPARAAALGQHQLHHRPRRLHAGRPLRLQREAQRGERRGQPRRPRRQPLVELRRRGADRRSRRARAARPDAALRHVGADREPGGADDPDGRRERPHPERQQQRLLPGQRARLDGLEPRAARGGALRLRRRGAAAARRAAAAGGAALAAGRSGGGGRAAGGALAPARRGGDERGGVDQRQGQGDGRGLRRRRRGGGADPQQRRRRGGALPDAALGVAPAVAAAARQRRRGASIPTRRRSPPATGSR